MKWIEENKHVIAILLLLIALFVLYKDIGQQFAVYRDKMSTVDILMEKNRLISQIDEKQLAEEVEKLSNVSERISSLFIVGNVPLFRIKSYVLRYSKSLLSFAGISEFKSINVSNVSLDKKDTMWGTITIRVDGVKGPKTYDGVINMLRKIEKADKLIYITNLNITYNEGDEYPYTITFTMQIPVVKLGGGGK